MPVILATQEAEIRRITVGSQPRQIVLNPISKNTQPKKGLEEGLMWCESLSSNPSYHTPQKVSSTRF
jgi:hypothetical protein